MAYVYEDYRDLKVIERVEEADGVVSIRLEAPEGERLPGWDPGAHIDVQLENGVERQYSLCSHFGADTWRIAILNEPQSRGGSSYIHEHVKVGDAVRTRGPRNNFPLVDAPAYLFIAGGIGVTPMIPMLGEVIFDKDAPWTFWYGGRTRASMAFRDRLEGLGVTLWPEDEKGLLPLKKILTDAAPDTAVYCCGPGPLIDAVEQACAKLGRPAPHVERFSAKAVDTDGDGGDHEFTVVVNSTGAEFSVPVDTSIVEVLQAGGVPIMTSCAEGVCGTCETKVIEGEIVHRDSLLSDEDKEEGIYMMPCVSRCKGDRLVLDL
ncbi:MAG: PDR/VanB family oxidoreductase [Candidatus Nanopelagicales bacterium]|jgi:ferredoxin-NADP reductase|nr:PDR/VanB family oxidoreductase [Candidatus Nanopelagicales bacterium]MCF8537667.1 PDR/VanB family oxidoreductase [Candidatus Nanopelagicales bacterium]MCF8542977.1 PDR/VanB family oxidoreductase [Candidatus Nanopelagicales bacterium]